MIHVLLTEVIAFYVQINIVKIEISGFERSIEIISNFDKWSRWGLVLDPINTSPHELLKKSLLSRASRANLGPKNAEPRDVELGAERLGFPC